MTDRPLTAIEAKLPHLPETPGVYLWKDAQGTVLYVGKAKRLRSRVRSYLAADHTSSPKTQVLMRQAADVETIVVPSEAHALILEATLIKEHAPRYNIQLRDDKSYPYIKVTVQEDFPRVFVTRRLHDDGARYFGPYTDVGGLRRAMEVVKRLYTVRSCRYDLLREAPERPCLDYHIKRCLAPCVGLQSRASYRAMIDEIVRFLGGRDDQVVTLVRTQMEAASERMDFERAAAYRDALQYLQRLEEPTVVVDVGGADRDVLGYARDGGEACVTLLRIRRGRLLAREHRFLENVEGEEDVTILAAYLAGAYVAATDRAAEVLLPMMVPELELLQVALERTRVLLPQRGVRRELLDLAEQNARHLLEESKLAGDDADERAADPVYELARELGLQRIPRSLVCFDISTSQGTDTVASVVWFENGRPRRSEYRTMRIKTVEGTDDFASMHEAVTRYVRRRVEEGRALPDLIVVDGGKGQLSAAAAALDALQLGHLPLASIAKREEELFQRGNPEAVRLSRRSPALRLVQQARDEAHRTAVGYNRKRRTARTVTSQLLEVPGIGPAKRRALLRAFGSLQGIREAPPEAIAALPGFSLIAATRLLIALHPDAQRPATAADAVSPASVELAPSPQAPASDDLQ
jgi:excinuclease ABC subunit C